MRFTLLSLFAFFLSTAALQAQTPNCQPKDCQKICEKICTKSAATAATTATKAEAKQVANKATSIDPANPLAKKSTCTKAEVASCAKAMAASCSKAKASTAAKTDEAKAMNVSLKAKPEAKATKKCLPANCDPKQCKKKG